MKKIIIVSLVMLTVFSFAFAQGSTEKATKFAWYAATAHPYFDEVEQGVDAFIADNPTLDVKKLYGPDWEQTSQDEKLRALVAEGCTYISTYPNSDGASGVESELMSNGVQVVGFGAQTSKKAEAFCVATDVKQAAYDACQAVIDAMGGKGGIFNVLEVLSDPNTQLRKQGVAECIAANPGVTLVQEVAGVENIEQGQEKILSGLSANIGKINGIVCTGNITSDACATILSDFYAQNPGADKIYAIGIDTADTVMKAIRDDVMFATIAQNPYGHGYIPLQILKLMTEGYKKVAGTYFIDSGAVVVTKENIDSFSADVKSTTERILGELVGKYLTK